MSNSPSLASVMRQVGTVNRTSHIGKISRGQSGGKSPALICRLGLPSASPCAKSTFDGAAHGTNCTELGSMASFRDCLMGTCCPMRGIVETSLLVPNAPCPYAPPTADAGARMYEDELESLLKYGFSCTLLFLTMCERGAHDVSDSLVSLVSQTTRETNRARTVQRRTSFRTEDMRAERKQQSTDSVAKAMRAAALLAAFCADPCK
mmetsp:Transcript_148710/g.277169  ORF Transcript_148710/g.277169 Transcript_148710/m.277169 type:complete len:206 (-) Transcript_148710:292-909(-)